MGLFAANPKPLTEAEPFLAVRFDRTRLQIGYQSEEPTEVGTANLEWRLTQQGRYCIPQCDPANSWLFRSANLQKNRRVQQCTHHLNRRPAPQATPLPRCRLRPQPHPTKDSRRLEPLPSRPTSRPAEWPVSPFVVANVPGTTRKHTNGLRLPCRNAAGLGMVVAIPTPRFYSGPTPRLQRLNHLPDLGAGTGDQAGC